MAGWQITKKAIVAVPMKSSLKVFLGLKTDHNYNSDYRRDGESKMLFFSSAKARECSPCT